MVVDSVREPVMIEVITVMAGAQVEAPGVEVALTIG